MPTPVTGPPPVATSNQEEVFSSTEGTWEWSPPELSLDSAFYKRSLSQLKRAARHYPKGDRGSIISDGKRDMANHRRNYGPDGPKHLQILWWQMPPEHWETLRVGGSMNFLVEPAEHLTANGEMTAEQLEIAIEFVDELLALGVLEESPDDDPVRATCPLFVLPKTGQPGQWRIIANAKAGGQNACVGSDPVVLPSADYVLRQMYSGGWSAVIDASKFFYQFRTVVTERKFLGLVHPGTGKVYRYAGLPMGCGNSPRIAGCLGAAFLRANPRRRNPPLALHLIRSAR